MNTTKLERLLIGILAVFFVICPLSTIAAVLIGKYVNDIGRYKYTLPFLAFLETLGSWIAASIFCLISYFPSLASACTVPLAIASTAFCMLRWPRIRIMDQKQSERPCRPVKRHKEEEIIEAEYWTEEEWDEQIKQSNKKLLKG